MLSVEIPRDIEKLKQTITVLENQIKEDGNDRDRQIHQKALQTLKKALKEREVEMNKIKGFNKLTQEQQQLLIRINERHKTGVETDYKDGWTPTSVKSLGRNLKVTFRNGEWLHYTPEGTWY